MTQQKRVLRALLKAGPHGITAVDFLAPDVIDNGLPITRVAARIGELRDQGLVILGRGVRDSCSRYVLLGSETAPEPICDDAEPAPLFAERSQYDPYGEAA